MADSITSIFLSPPRHSVITRAYCRSSHFSPGFSLCTLMSQGAVLLHLFFWLLISFRSEAESRKPILSSLFLLFQPNISLPASLWQFYGSIHPWRARGSRGHSKSHHQAPPLLSRRGILKAAHPAYPEALWPRPAGTTISPSLSLKPAGKF